MQRAFLQARATGRAAGIILVLAIFTLPTAAVFAARASAPVGVVTLPNDAPTEIPNWEEPPNANFPIGDCVPVVYDPNIGVTEYGAYPESKKPQDVREGNKPYTSPTPVWPISPTVKVVSKWPFGDTIECSGVLIDQAVVLTSAQCVFTHDTEFCGIEENCWAADIEIIIYPNTGEQVSNFTQVLTWTAWTENHDFNYDLAGIKLDQPLGDTVGWLGFGYNNDNQFFTSKTFEHTSYVNTTLTFWSDVFTKIEDHLFYSNGSSRYGQAGAGAHRNEYDHIVYSVLSHQRELEGEAKTGHTRITPDKFFALRDWINGNIKDLNFITYLPLITD